jgi:Ca2+-binding RTX toxin-like protein
MTATDILSFDSPTISAASLSLSYAGDYTVISLTAGGITFSLSASVSLASFTTGNVIFANGSRLIVGDNSSGGNDILANTLIGSTGHDQLLGLAGNDVLNGGTGADLLKGGLGNDTYVVDNAGDVVDETPTLDPLRVSTDAAGVQGNDSSSNAQFSADGRYVVFRSAASNLVAGDSNGTNDIFVKDLQSGAIQRVSTDAAGAQGNGSSYRAQFSADGHSVVFESTASNLVAGDSNGTNDIFVKDLQSGAIRRVSTDAAGAQGNGQSSDARFSADGRYVVFESDASNLVAGDSNGTWDIFVKDLQSGAIQRVSTDAAGVQGNNGSFNAQFSADGRYVVFRSGASNLVAGDINGARDIFVKDLQSGAIQRVSTDAAGAEGNDHSDYAQFSADGRYVVFESDASNLVAGDYNGDCDIFVKDLQSGAIQRVSTDAAGAQGNGDSTSAQFSADGRYVVFQSNANNLVAGDSSYAVDVFVKDLQSGAIERVSSNAAGVQGNASSNSAQFSADGRYVVFESNANNLVAGDSNNTSDIFRVLNPFVQGGGGSDTVNSSIDHTLAAHVENLTLTGTGALDGTGNGLANRLIGNSGANSLSGGAGDDTLDGGAGADLLVGGTGNDVLTGGDGTDTASFAGATLGVQVSLALAGAQATGVGNDSLIAIENLTGSSYDDTLLGNTGNNLLDGGAGLDLLAGGLGNDTYIVDSLGDLVIEETNEGTDQVQARVSYKLGDNVENLTLLGTTNLSAFGNGLANVLTGNAGSNLINGGAGTDTASFANATAAVTVSLALATAQVTGGSGTDTLIGIENLTGSNYNDRLTGTTGANSLNGLAGNDILDGGSGIDTMTGGDGSDIYYVRDSGDLVSETNAVAATGGSDTVYSYLSSYTLGTNVENGRILATGAANLTGNTLNNLLYAGAGNNLLNGSTGTDTVSYVYGVSGTTGVTVSLALATAQATGGSGTDTLLSIENLTGSNYNDRLTGTTGANNLNGLAGIDILDGGSGIDTMTGGDGSDIYYVRDLGDLVSETNAVAATGGTDIVFSYLSTYTLGTNVENGRILATGAANLTGNTLDNLLYAGAGNNTLNGSTGTDTVSYAYGLSGTTGVTVSLALATAQATGGSGTDTLISIENLTGSNYNDRLTGTTGANSLNGGAGNDTLTGGAGKDQLTGGTGNDTFDFGVGVVYWHWRMRYAYFTPWVWRGSSRGCSRRLAWQCE